MLVTAYQTFTCSVSVSCLAWIETKFQRLNKLIVNPRQIQNWWVPFEVEYISFVTDRISKPNEIFIVVKGKIYLLLLHAFYCLLMFL